MQEFKSQTSVDDGDDLWQEMVRVYIENNGFGESFFNGLDGSENDGPFAYQ